MAQPAKPGVRPQQLPRVIDRVRQRVPLIPASYFGIVLGLGGWANSWRAAHHAWGAPVAVGEALFGIAAAVWVVIAALYGVKWIVASEVARAEAVHPVQCCFIGLGGVATLVMAQGALPYDRAAAMLLFAVGAAFTFGFGLWRTGQLWQGAREAEATTPVLLLPVVAGGFVTAITAGALGWHDSAALAFGASFFAWLAIESVILHRLYTAAPMAPALRPTLGIQLAPPTVGAIAYLATGADPASILPKAMIGYALLQALILVRLWRWITAQPFAPSWWAVTFGATALPGALIRLSLASSDPALADLGLLVFVASNIVMVAIVLRTIGWLIARP